ncbi:acyl-CoA synthetase [Saccharothrix mutabilis subsp. mutabilis]|uniref:Acyl-CoA synthetase n=1 Tax=Saccharothrix mutabilis subsp. mutabilis TaxID=66855 RepID=A0ABN0USR1_9PSEU
MVKLLHCVRVLGRAGLVEPLRPVRAARSLVEVRAHGPLLGSVLRGARHQPDAVALIDEDGQRTYRELHERSAALARALHGSGIRSDHVVALLCRNHRGAVEAMLACARIGARALLLNTGFAGPQLADVTRREQVVALVHDEEFAAVVAEAPPEVARFPTADFDALIASAPSAEPARPDRPGQVVLLTSGTTGTPKGAHREVRSAFAAVDFLDRIPLRARETSLIAAPVFHGIGFAHLVLALGLGSTVVLRRRFDAREAVELLARHRCTAIMLVPTMLRRILDLGPVELQSHDLSALRVVLSSGSDLPAPLAEEATRRFGEVVYDLYGSTEVAVATVATPADLRAAPGTVGRPPRTCVVRLYDAAGKRVTRPGEVGRVFVGSGLRFSGYSGGGGKDTVDGLVSTGDLGHFDAGGRLFVDGREDDMIVSGGENVYPSEVENLLATHYQVRESVVLGVPDEKFGQRLRAFVVPVPGARLDPEALKVFVRDRLARHKVPREVVLLPALPRNATGKVLRRELR